MDELKNIGASVRARLLNISRQSGMDYQLVLTRYVLERLLYRISISPHKEEFVGGFKVRNEHRSTEWGRMV